MPQPHCGQLASPVLASLGVPVHYTVCCICSLTSVMFAERQLATVDANSQTHQKRLSCAQIGGKSPGREVRGGI